MTIYLSKYISMQPAGIVRNSHLRFQISIEYFIVYYKSSRNKLDLIWKSDYIISWIILQLPKRKKTNQRVIDFLWEKKSFHNYIYGYNDITSISNCKFWTYATYWFVTHCSNIDVMLKLIYINMFNLYYI